MYPQIKPRARARDGDALTRASNASRMLFQSPGGIPCIYIPYVATSSHTATRRHALESTAPPPMASGARASLVSRRRLCNPVPHHKRRRRVLAGYSKLFKWDLLDGTLPNALPASSRSTASYKIQNPKELIRLRGAIRPSTFDGMSVFRQHAHGTLKPEELPGGTPSTRERDALSLPDPAL